jgi:glycerophosphoryl diester phosphodiesterase
LDSKPSQPTKLLYAHRGANFRLPENTIEAFRQGLQDGANALEMDVHATLDDVVIVFHDEDGQRLAGRGDLVRKTRWSTIKTWDLGANLRADPVARHFMDKTFRVPTFEEVLNAFPSVPLNVDIKPDSLRLTSLIIELIRKAKAVERVRLTSSHLSVHNMLHALRYEGPVGMSSLEVYALYFAPEAWLQNMRLQNRAVQMPLRHGPFRLDGKNFIDKCHRLGMRVDYWVINNRDMAKELLAKGADGIMSDDPATILSVFPF